MRLQRLNPATDEAIYRQLYEWNRSTPDWFRASDEAWGKDCWEEFYGREWRDDLIDCAVYDDGGQLQGSITVIHVGAKVWEVFIIGKRHADAECLTTGAFVMAQELVAAGLVQAFTSWVCEKNRGALRLNRSAGMLPTGLTLLKGEYRGRPLKFINLAMSAERARVLAQAVGGGL